MDWRMEQNRLYCHVQHDNFSLVSLLNTRITTTIHSVTLYLGDFKKSRTGWFGQKENTMYATNTQMYGQLLRQFLNFLSTDSISQPPPCLTPYTFTNSSTAVLTWALVTHASHQWFRLGSEASWSPSSLWRALHLLRWSPKQTQLRLLYFT